MLQGDQNKAAPSHIMSPQTPSEDEGTSQKLK
jgi:hypothetical protein